MTQAARINDFYHAAPASLQAMIALSTSVKKSSLGIRLVELVNLRISQINGCGVCIDMHWRDLIKQGMDPRHVNAIGGWREAPPSFFSASERAALNWAEAANALPHQQPGDDDFAQLKAHFDDNQIIELSYGIAVIRGWNVINASLHNQIPEVPAPGF
ncbi:carboxymuconolactone decarboxylase family protein [Duganella phyllosphaerae]|uniref:Alkyl hydroperoxide reductase AhpD n=1 Tax=Duganella phyllosphaerae TaxID=762836 RepID=A0A1E7WHU5_9BURK|nr:carboxymuconolactone decarboxylase family protein [Duganella phyllosphaerae]OEZ98226.1 alkyl hydroperoxide reductase AhpD [Duganella phyllosphaerae]